MGNQLKADLWLLVVTIFWGTSYVLMKMGLGEMEPLTLIGFRFGIAFLLAGSIFFKRFLRLDFRTFKISVFVGSVLFLVFVLVTFGLKLTTASNAGFLIGLTVVIVPLLQAFVLKSPPKINGIIGVFFALIGIFLLTVREGLTMNFGDILCILCAILCAIHIILVEKFTHDIDSTMFGILQLGVVAFLSIIFSFVFESPKLPNSFDSILIILILSIFCTALSYIAQTTAQQYTSPTHTGLIFSLESVFSAIFAYFFAGEILTQKGYLGAIFLVIGTFVAEINFSKLFK